MTTVPLPSSPPHEQHRKLPQLYALLTRQVKSYHKARHMGENTSISVELARELLLSIEYTLEQVGEMAWNSDLEQVLSAGQEILSQKGKDAFHLLRLVEATAPSWQGECRWDTIRSLARFLQTYDSFHLAHISPEILYYPHPLNIPPQCVGIDLAIFYLRLLWAENQIMAAFPETILSSFWSAFCRDDRTLTENQCQQLVTQFLGKQMIGSPMMSLLFSPEDYDKLYWIPLQTRKAPCPIPAAGVEEYWNAAVSEFQIRFRRGLQNRTLETLFLPDIWV